MSDFNAKGQLLKFEEMRRSLGADENSSGAFGVSISKSDNRNVSVANSQMTSFIDNLVIDNSLPVYVASAEGMLMHVNEKYTELASSMGDVSLSPGPLQIMNKMPSPTIMPVVQDVLASGTTVKSAESLVIRGKKYIFEGRHMPITNSRGDIIAIAGTYEDVTAITKTIQDAKQTKTRFQDFARASSDWLWELDEDLKVKTLSDRFTSVVGQPAMMFIGSKLDQFGEFKINLSGNNDGEHAIRSKKPFRDQLFIIHDYTGKEQLFHLSGVPVFDRTSGEFLGYRGVGKDVSVRYEKAKEFNEANELLQSAMADLTRNNIDLELAKQEAQAALKTKNDFLASMSHELKTPLNAIIGFAESFVGQKFGELNDEYVNFAHDIHDAGQHLLGLINDVLDVTLMESKSLKLKTTAVPVKSMIHKASHILHCQAEEKNIQFIISEIDENLCIDGDEKRVMQILINLLTNAVKFTPENGKVGVIVKDGPLDAVNITVWDSGIGIDCKDHEKIFEKFHQVTDDFYARKQNGSGLGLHISRELAKAMGGDISVESEMGQGAKFKVTLTKSEDGFDNLDYL